MLESYNYPLKPQILCQLLYPPVYPARLTFDLHISFSPDTFCLLQWPHCLSSDPLSLLTSIQTSSPKRCLFISEVSSPSSFILPTVRLCISPESKLGLPLCSQIPTPPNILAHLPPKWPLRSQAHLNYFLRQFVSGSSHNSQERLKSCFFPYTLTAPSFETIAQTYLTSVL